MKKLLLFVLVIMAVSLYSQIGWEATGKPIRNGVNIEWFRAGTPTNDGSIVYVGVIPETETEMFGLKKFPLNHKHLFGVKAVN